MIRSVMMILNMVVVLICKWRICIKTETVKGVGLIKPEETFVDTDVVRDRYAFDAENGDYIINGPASDVMRQPINVH